MMSRDVHQFLKNFIDNNEESNIEVIWKAAIKEYKREVDLFQFNQI